MEQELAIKLQDNGISYQTQVELPVTSADFYFAIEPRPLIVFVDGRVHLKTGQMTKEEETRTLLRKKSYRILELQYERLPRREKITTLTARMKYQEQYLANLNSTARIWLEFLSTKLG